MIKRMTVVALAAFLAGCISTPPREYYQYSKTWTVSKSKDDLMRAAIIGMFRVWRSPVATVKYDSRDLGLVISEGRTTLVLPDDTITRVYGPLTADVTFRLVVEVRDGGVRASIEDVNEAKFSATTGWTYSTGLTKDQAEVFQVNVDALLAVLERALRDPAW